MRELYKKSHWKGLPASSQGYRRREGWDAKLISVRNTIDEKRSRYRQGLGFFPINKWIHQRSFFHRHKRIHYKTEKLSTARQYFLFFCLKDFFKFISSYSHKIKRKQSCLKKAKKKCKEKFYARVFREVSKVDHLVLIAISCGYKRTKRRKEKRKPQQWQMKKFFSMTFMSSVRSLASEYHTHSDLSPMNPIN